MAVATMVADVVLDTGPQDADPLDYHTAEATLELHFGARVLTDAVVAYLDALGASRPVAPAGASRRASRPDPSDVVARVQGSDRCRVEGILRLLARYGFTVAVEPDWGIDLLSQATPTEHLAARVRAAAERTLTATGRMPPDRWRIGAVSEEATAMFLEWIELMTLRYRDELTAALAAVTASSATGS
jgi:hypothetical protein